MRKEGIRKDGTKNGAGDPADAEFDALFSNTIEHPVRRSETRSPNTTRGSAGAAGGSKVASEMVAPVALTSAAELAAAGGGGRPSALSSSMSSANKTKGARKHISYADDQHKQSDDGGSESDDDDVQYADASEAAGGAADKLNGGSHGVGDDEEEEGGDGTTVAAAPAGADGDESYEVEDIMAHKLYRKRLLFQVRWKGYAEADDTWEPEEALDCAEIIERYRAAHPDAVPTPKVRKLLKANKSSGRAGRANTHTGLEYKVDQIVGHRIERKANVFLIRWVGYTETDDTWEREQTLNCPELLAAYKAEHAEQMAPARAPRKPRQHEVNADGSVDYEVAKVVAKRVARGGAVEYQVRWKNYGPSSDTWEAEANLSCPELIERFEAQQSSMRPSSKREAKDRAINYDSESETEEVLPSKKRKTIGATGGGKAGKAAKDKDYEVEKIVDVATEKGKKFYLVKWKGWPASSNTWEPLASLSCAELLKKFEAKKKALGKRPVPTKAARKATVVASPVKAKGGRGRPRKVEAATPKKGAAGRKASKTPVRGSAVKRSASKTMKTPVPAKKPAITARGGRNAKLVQYEEVDVDMDPFADVEVEWEVQKILDVKAARDGSRQFLIRWKGCGAAQDTWEPEDNVDSPKLVKEFMKSGAGGGGKASKSASSPAKKDKKKDKKDKAKKSKSSSSTKKNKSAKKSKK